MQQLKIDTNVILLSELDIHAKGDRLIIEICKKLGASRFLMQKAARKYLNDEHFKTEGIQLMDFRLHSPIKTDLSFN